MSNFATNRFAGDGVTTSYTINFVGGYLDKSHVKAYIEDNVTQVQTEIYINPLSFVTPYTLVGFAGVRSAEKGSAWAPGKSHCPPSSIALERRAMKIGCPRQLMTSCWPSSSAPMSCDTGAPAKRARADRDVF